MGTVFGMPEFLNVTARSPQYADSLKLFEDYANYELMDRIKIKKKMEPSILTLEKFGNGIAKAYYNKVLRFGVREVGGVETEFPVSIYDGADVASVHPSRFMMPFNSQDPQMAPWAGELRTATNSALQAYEDSGMFDKGITKEIGEFYVTAPEQQDRVQLAQEQNENRVPIVPNVQQEYYEIWTEWDIDKSGDKKAVQIFYHYDAQVVMGVRYNNFSDLRRPYRCGVYIPVEGRWAGIGICKQNDQFQLEVTIQHRQRIDNATIANIRMFKVAKMSGYGPKEPVFPGKMWFLDDMRDIEAFQLGEIYPSSFNNEQQAVLYSQQRTGVNELTLGMPSAGTPGTATGDLTRVQESKRKFDFIVNNIKDYTLDVVYDIFDIIQTYGPKQVTYAQANDPTGELMRILSLPNEAIRDSVIFKMNISGQSSNQILDQQNLQQVASFTTQYWQQMIALAQGMENPQLAQQMSMKAMSAATEVTKQLYEGLNVKNIERLLFDPSSMAPPPQQMAPPPNAMGMQNVGEQLLGGGGNPRAEIPQSQQGMGNPTIAPS